MSWKPACVLIIIMKHHVMTDQTWECEELSVVVRMSEVQTLPRELFPLTVQEFLAAKQGLASRGQSLDFTFDYIQWLCEGDRAHCGELLENILSEDNAVSSVAKLTQTPEKSDNSDKLFGVIPRHGYLLLFLPFFPIILVFVSANGVAFFITGFLETLLRYMDLYVDGKKRNHIFSSMLLNPSPELVGKIWISLTFVLFSPFIYFLYSILRNLVSK